MSRKHSIVCPFPEEFSDLTEKQMRVNVVWHWPFSCALRLHANWWRKFLNDSLNIATWGVLGEVGVTQSPWANYRSIAHSHRGEITTPSQWQRRVSGRIRKLLGVGNPHALPWPARFFSPQCILLKCSFSLSLSVTLFNGTRASHKTVLNRAIRPKHRRRGNFSADHLFPESSPQHLYTWAPQNS